MPKMDAAELNSNLRQFSGSDEIFKYKPFGRSVLVRAEKFDEPVCTVCYTQGIEFLCKNGEAYWLLDAIVSHLPKVLKNDDAQTVHFWSLVKVDKIDPKKHKINPKTIPKGTAAVLIAQIDSGTTPLAKQFIEFTDFPFDDDGVVKIWAGATIAEFGNIINIHLPSEH